MFKKVIPFYCLFAIGLAYAEPLDDEHLKGLGRALANYQSCAQIAEHRGDKAMQNYYIEMFNDSFSDINTYPKSRSAIVFEAFNQGMDKLSQFDNEMLGQFCLSRFSLLSRQIQEKKLSMKLMPFTE